MWRLHIFIDCVCCESGDAGDRRFAPARRCPDEVFLETTMGCTVGVTVKSVYSCTRTNASFYLCLVPSGVAVP